MSSAVKLHALKKSDVHFLSKKTFITALQLSIHIILYYIGTHRRIEITSIPIQSYIIVERLRSCVRINVVSNNIIIIIIIIRRKYSIPSRIKQDHPLRSTRTSVII